MATFDQILTAKAIHIGKLAAQATTAAGSGHPSTALSLATITAVIMYHAMRWDPADPANAGSDRLVLSEGHAVPIIYAACADLGVTIYPGAVGHTADKKSGDGEGKKMTTDDLMTLRAINSPIDGHPNPMMGFPFFDAATGSLGQGLSVAGGLGAAARVDKHNKLIYCIIGDGESREGQIWEAMDFIAEHKLSNVVAIFNCNEIAQSDYVAAAQTADALAKKAEAFGWKVLIVDGHNPTELVSALKQRTEAMVAGKPLCIVARTVKGWGAASQQGLGHHGTPISEKNIASVLKELDDTAAELGASAASADDLKTLKPKPPLAAPAKPTVGKTMTLAQAAEKAKLTDALITKKKLSPRRAFGLALDALGDANPNIVALDADVKNSTFTQDFAKDHPSHFFECRIAEQNMVSVAAGLASGHKIPFASTFGKFFSRAFDQIEMAIIGGSNIKLVGTHIGVTLAADGPSQMAITDVPILRAIGHATDHRGNPAITVLTPSDAVSTYALVLAMADFSSAVYLRALRADTAILYPESETFPFGAFKVIKKGSGKGGKKLTIVTNGYLVHTVLKAAPQFEVAGIDVTLVDAYCLPFNTDELLSLAAGGPILTVEDNYTGGVGSEVAEAAAKSAKQVVHSMFVQNLPKSGKTPEDVLEFVHLGEADIIAKAKEITA